MTQKTPLTGSYANNVLVPLEFSAGDTINVSFLATGTANANTILFGDGTWKNNINVSLLGTGTANANTILFGDGTWKNNINVSLLGTGTANANTILFGDGTWKIFPPLNGTLIAYDSRSTLKTMTPKNNDLIFVESLGLFKFYLGSVEIDDDETCFTTSSGAWMLEIPHWDLIDANYFLEKEMQNERIEILESKFLTGIATNSVTKLDAMSQNVLKTIIPGAVPGVVAVVSPNINLDVRINLYAYVSLDDVVSVVINNPTQSAATLNPGTWKVVVIK